MGLAGGETWLDRISGKLRAFEFWPERSSLVQVLLQRTGKNKIKIVIHNLLIAMSFSAKENILRKFASGACEAFYPQLQSFILRAGLSCSGRYTCCYHHYILSITLFR